MKVFAVMDYDKKLADLEIFLLALRKTVNEGLATVATLRQVQPGAILKRPSKKPKKSELQATVGDIRSRILRGERKPRK